MYIYKLPNAAASVITVTATATSLFDLIETAASTAHGLPEGLINAIDLYVEDGDIRVLMDGNTPTASLGVLLKRGGRYCFRGVPVTKLKLIRTGSANVSVSLAVGVSDDRESTNVAEVQSTSGLGTNYTSAEGKEFSITGAQTDYNVASSQTMFAVTRTKVLILADAACVVEVNTGTSPALTINLKANEQHTIENFPVTNLFITTTGTTAVRVIAYV